MKRSIVISATLLLSACSTADRDERDLNFEESLDGIRICYPQYSSNSVATPEIVSAASGGVIDLKFYLNTELDMLPPKPLASFFWLEIMHNSKSIGQLKPMQVTAKVYSSNAVIQNDTSIPDSCKRESTLTQLIFQLPSGLSLSPDHTYQLRWNGYSAAQPEAPSLSERASQQGGGLKLATGRRFFKAVMPQTRLLIHAMELNFSFANYVKLLSVSQLQAISASTTVADLFGPGVDGSREMPEVSSLSLVSAPPAFHLYAGESIRHRHEQSLASPQSPLPELSESSFDDAHGKPEVALVAVQANHSLSNFVDSLHTALNDAFAWSQFLQNADAVVPLSVATADNRTKLILTPHYGDFSSLKPYHRDSRSGHIMILIAAKFTTLDGRGQAALRHSPHGHGFVLGGFAYEPSRSAMEAYQFFDHLPRGSIDPVSAREGN